MSRVSDGRRATKERNERCTQLCLFLLNLFPLYRKSCAERHEPGSEQKQQLLSSLTKKQTCINTAFLVPLTSPTALRVSSFFFKSFSLLFIVSQVWSKEEGFFSSPKFCLQFSFLSALLPFRCYCPCSSSSPSSLLLLLSFPSFHLPLLVSPPKNFSLPTLTRRTTRRRSEFPLSRFSK